VEEVVRHSRSKKGELKQGTVHNFRHGGKKGSLFGGEEKETGAAPPRGGGGSRERNRGWGIKKERSERKILSAVKKNKGTEIVSFQHSGKKGKRGRINRKEVERLENPIYKLIRL